MSDWFSKVDQDISPIFKAICQHEFIQQLINGSLNKAVFQFYIQQDRLYLSVYKKLLAAIGSQSESNEDCQFFLTSATGVLAVEQALHQQYASNQASTQPSPSCELYTGFLARMVYTQPLPVAMAAVLPCFTIYKAVGDYILRQPQVEKNPYQDWINTYGGEEFAHATARAIEITNRHAENSNTKTLEQMNSAFIKAAKLEWMFWNSAFKQEQWEI